MLNATILIDTRLTDFEKLNHILWLTDFLRGSKGCFASDDYFCEILNKSEPTVNRALRKLEELEYIFRFTQNKGKDRGAKKSIYTQETLKNKKRPTIKNRADQQSKTRKSTIKNECPLIDNIINNLTTDSELSKIEKVKERVMQIARENKYKMSKVALELSKIHDLSELKTYEKRIINKEMK